MQFHVPFDQRSSNHRHYGTIIIDPPAPSPAKKFNWWGFSGMWLSFLGLLTMGLLSPLALLFSLQGLRRRGKTMASIGTAASLLGVGILASIILIGTRINRQVTLQQQAAIVAKTNAENYQTTQSLLGEAYDAVIEYRGQHDGRLPTGIDGNVLVVEYVDPWGTELRYDAEPKFALIRSAGPDQKFLSADDIVRQVKPAIAKTANVSSPSF